jgi:hypothetical protein
MRGFAVTNTALQEIVEREPFFVVFCRRVERLNLLCLVINPGLFGELGVFTFLQQTIEAVR